MQIIEVVPPLRILPHADIADDQRGEVGGGLGVPARRSPPGGVVGLPTTVLDWVRRGEVETGKLGYEFVAQPSIWPYLYV